MSTTTDFTASPVAPPVGVVGPMGMVMGSKKWEMGNLLSEFYKKMNVNLPGMGQTSGDKTDDSWSDDISDDSDEYDPADASDEEEETKMNPRLMRDIECVTRLYGSDAIKYRAFHCIDDIDVSLCIDMMMLDSATAAAWKVKRDEPVIIRLHMSLSQYLEGPPSKVDVFQPSQNEKFGIGIQLCKIMELFINSNWALASLEDHNSDTEDVAGGDKSDSESLAINDDALAQILSMGFPLDLSRNALVMTSGDTEQAINLLISDPDCLSHPQASSVCPGDAPSKLPTQPQHLVPAASQVDTTLSESFAQKMSVLTCHDSKDMAVHGAKEVPSLESGFLVQVMKYARQRLLTLNEFCVICDEPHISQNGAMLTPVVCARDLCVFSFQTLRVMSDAAENIATQPEVVDVLITMAIAACKSKRRQIIFDPYPTVVNPLNPSDLAFEPRNRNFDKVSKVLDVFMSIEKMTDLYGSKLTEELDRQDILAYPLLQWIISSNRSYIVKLPPEKQLAFMHTPHQFSLICSPPAKEAIFRAEREKYGSTFAFHGSPMENWHSILRHGLMLASGTKLQMHGSRYGKGIYMSPISGKSFGYSSMAVRFPFLRPTPLGATIWPTVTQKIEERFLTMKNPACVALCEVVTSDGLKKCTNTIWLTTNPDHVCTRFFFVYENALAGDSQSDTQSYIFNSCQVDTQSDIYKVEILQAVKYQFR